MQLVLSIFPGIDLLGMAFEQEGFCVVQSRDWIFGGDIRGTHFPSGRFDGVIGGPPCQAFSRLTHMVRQNGLYPKFGNLIPEFERVVIETRSQWFVMEEVPDAPRPKVSGYETHEFILNNRQCVDANGNPATPNRSRAITFGYRGERRPLLLDVVCLEATEFEYAATGGSARPVAMNRGCQPKRFRDGNSHMPFNSRSRAAVKELCRKQGIPEEYVTRMPFTVDAACKALGNGVPLAMGRTIARGVRECTQAANFGEAGETDE